MVRKQNTPASGARSDRRFATTWNALYRRITLAVPLALVAVALSMMLSVPRAYAGPVEDLGNAFMQFFGLAEEPAPAAAFDETAVADPSTVTSWESIAGQNTQNIGRIWTDKSVSTEDVQLPPSPAGNVPVVAKGDSDFLVTLSALSSTSNTSVTSSKPLDIVLVLDASGSMKDPIGNAYVYSKAYRINTDGWTTYYAQAEDGSYVEVERVLKWGLVGFDHWELNGVTVVPKASANDTDPSHIQFYTRKTVEMSKMDALHEAANAFIESTAQQNDNIADTAKQHRISIVKFAGNKRDSIGNDTYRKGDYRYNYSQIVVGLTPYTTNGENPVLEATNEVNKISAAGATSADYGMQHAQTVLNGARPGAQKVVIFFTDGEPNHNNDFDNDVANAAIAASKALKDEKALVYTIGVFKEADPTNTAPSDTNKFNAYMHAMSSNYPNASKWNDLGDRVADSNYYKAATDADQLNKIFQEISDEINAGAGLPTETEEGFENTSGYITFTDELGAYMQVDGFKELVFADKVFEPVGEPTKKDNVYTYTYEGTGDTALYPNGDVSNIKVEVTKSADLAQGDVVRVQIPGSLIPLRNFKVKSDGSGTTMEISEAYPLRIFYGVSVKPGVVKALSDGTADQALKSYITAHTVDGKTSFYSNYFDGSVTSGNKTLGNTTASFVPASGNSFYYFTVDTPLYTNAACTQKLMEEPVAGQEYYYKRTYYKKNATTGEVTQEEYTTRFVGAQFDGTKTFYGQASDGSYYIKAGFPRVTRVTDLTLPKETNATGTATEVINPNWDNINDPYAVNVSLGNNGKIDVELPGTLAIKKDARVAQNKGLSADTIKNKQFTFKIDIPDAKNKALKAEVKNEQGEVTAQLFDITFDANGTARHTITGGETLYIYGLDADAGYTVDETSIPFGFSPTNRTNDKGTIAGNSVTNVTFENTYDVQAITVHGEDFATYRKAFDNWDVTDSFEIRLSEDNKENPMPEGSVVGPDNMEDKSAQATEKMPGGNFGDITFAAAGEYIYTIFEVTPSKAVAGMTYSKASYSVVVTVTDKGDGTLEASTKMLKLSDENGETLNPYQEITSKEAVFTNSFNAESVSSGPVAQKVYTNNGGSENNLTNGMFRFKVKAIGGNATQAPLPEGATPDSEGYLYATNDGPAVAFGQALFTADHVGDTYTYEFSEVMPAAATAENDYTVAGMTYDPSVYTAEFAVSSEDVNGTPTVKVTVTYKKDGEVLPEGQVPQFRNSYDPTDAALVDDTALAVSKTLRGRDSKEAEAFKFTLAARSNATIGALERDEIVFADDPSATEMTVEIGNLKNGVASTAKFGKIEFTKPGTFTFDVKENVPAEDGAGMTYDRTTQTVTVIVEDNNGVLEVKSVSYTGGGNSAPFTNTYTASHTYGTGMKLDASKMLMGRAQKAGEFQFTIKGLASDTVSAKDAEAKLAETDKSFTTIAPAPDTVASVMSGKLASVKFTQADAGKTFSYILSEVVPADKDKLGGVTYDETSYLIDIAVVDNGDGTMHTVTTINGKLGDATELVGVFDSADSNGPDAIELSFTNMYKAAPVEVDPVKSNIELTKILKGRDWKDTDEFTFTLSSKEGNPMPTSVTKTVTNPGGKDGAEFKFNFGANTFTEAGEYFYTVTETKGDIPGITYDEHVADVHVYVTDPGDGQLVARTEVYNTTFTNEYKAELDHNKAGGILMTKVTNGHSMDTGQFQFQVEALPGTGTTAEDAAERIGIMSGTTGQVGNVASADGVKVVMDSKNPIIFTQADVGKSFKFKFSELGADGKPGTGGTKDGYTYSDAVYTVELWVTDDTVGNLTLHTKVNDSPEQTSSAADPVPTYLDFVNSYQAETTADTDVDLTAIKTLTGRDMKDGEFNFKVVTNPIDEAGSARDVTTATNAAAKSGKAGSVTFEKASLGYKLSDLKTLAADESADRYVEAGTTKDGKPQYTLHYTAYEVTDNLPAGVTAGKSTFDFTVTVVDNGDGTLSAAASYPEGGLAFTNSYQWDPAVVDPDALADAPATKVLKGNRGTALAAGEFTFKMSTVATKGSLGTVKDADGAAWPSEKVVANNADGSVDFGSMSFSDEGVYEVTIWEVPGNAPYMTYDGHKFTYTITVTYSAATGKLAAKVTGASKGEATFTNIYFDESTAKDVTVANDPQTSVDGKLVGVGDTLVYSIDWVNNAVDKDGKPTNATITITDKVPFGTEFVGASEGGKHENGVVTWTLADQKPGAKGTVTLTVKVTDAAVTTGAVNNQASIKIGDHESKTNTTTTLVPGKSETTHPDKVEPGDVLTYQIKFRNTDGAGASATVVDTLTPGVTYQQGSATVDGVANEPTVNTDSEGNTVLTWALDGLAENQDVILTFNVVVDEDGPNEVHNQATVNGHSTNIETTPFPTNDKKHAYKGDVLVDGKLVGAGDTLTFKIDWYHTEALDGDNATVTVVDTLPEGMKPIDGTISNDGKYDATAGTITWTINDAAGKHGTVSFEAEITDEVIERAMNGEVTNIAQVNNHANQTVTVNVPTKSVKNEGTDAIKVGDTVTYTITYKNTEDTAATVTITDKLPKGLTYVEDSASNGGVFKDGTITWTIENVPAGQGGFVTFSGVVNESAIIDGVDNQASIKLGDNDPVCKTDTEEITIAKGGLSISKRVVSAVSGVTAPDTEFTFTVALVDAGGNPLTGTYSYVGLGGAGNGTITSGGALKLKAGQSITIKGLPQGAVCTVTETPIPNGFTTSEPVKTGTVVGGGVVMANFTNAYTPGDAVVEGSTDLKVKKQLEGRDWLADEQFTFQISAETRNAPMPQSDTVTLTKDVQTGSFGDISFGKPGTYKYKIMETGTSPDANLVYSKAEYQLVVTVEPDGSKLKVTSVMTQVKGDQGESANSIVADKTAVFTNIYTEPKQDKDVVNATDPSTTVDGKLVTVGSKLVYTINWVNDAVDAKGAAVAADIVIADEVPTGTKFVSAENGGSYDEATNTITWTLGEQAANASGSVSFTVEVTDDAKGIVDNTASITIGNNDPKQTDTPKVSVPNKDVTDDNGNTPQVGDVLTYTVSYANPQDKPATVTITDKLPKGLSYIENSATDGGVFKDGTITWTIPDVGPGQGGKVTFKATINSDAVTGTDPITNAATVEVGNDSVTTDSTTTEVKTGILEVSKTVVLGEGQGSVDANKQFEFKLELKDASGKVLEGKYDVGIGEVHSWIKSGETFKLKHGETAIIEGLPEGATYTVTETAASGYTTDKTGDTGTISSEAPAQASFTNTYTASIPSDKPVTTNGLFSKVLNGRDWKKSDSFTFTIAPKDGGPALEPSEVTLTGLTTAKGEAVPFDFGNIKFSFSDIADVAPDAQGKRTKTFTYEVREAIPAANEGKIAGITYDNHVATLTVTLTDDGNGVLSATCNVKNGTFTNVYQSGSVNVDDVNTAGGVQIVKTMTGRAIAANDFEFTMKPTNDHAEDKFGAAKTFKTAGAALGTGADANTAVETIKIPTGLTFGLDDAGKKFTFDVAETKGDAAGYTYDTTPHKLVFEVTDDGAGTLTVTVKLDGDQVAEWSGTVATRAITDVVSVPFNNSYSAGSITVGGEGDVALTGTKKLTGRPMVAGEFHFNVTDVKGNPVSTGTNTADGAINFDVITYTTEKLNLDVAAGIATVERGVDVDVYSYTYTVSEDASKNDAGISIIQGSQTITVKVTDNHAGKLAAEVVYPDGGMVFENAYGAGEDGTAKLGINGTKVLEVASGDKAPDIEGKYTFTLTGSEGAPMPDKTTATNDDSGSVSFGEITYTMENVFGDSGVKAEEPEAEQAPVEASAADAAEAAVDADAKAVDDAATADAPAAGAAIADEPMVASAERTKTFTYTVTESGSVAGVTNDANPTRTITVTVVDSGDGKLSVSKSTEPATTDFMFTNTYSVAPQESSLTGEGNFAITKTLDGRDLREGEFEFALVSQAEGMPSVLTAANDASGNVVFPAITFTEPGTYKYSLAEVAGELGGVTYDEAVYDVIATVTDNGDGTLAVAWSVGRAGEPLEGTDIAFANSYQARGTSLTFVASKLLSGRDIVEGEFEFELLEDGKVIATAKNGAPDESGSAWIKFDEVAYTEVGEHDYVIREVKGNAIGVVYDETEFSYHVVVTDPGDGQLEVEWTEGETGAPVFKNTYVKPADPKPDPDGSGTSTGGLVQTGDNTALAVGVAAVIGIIAIGIGILVRRKSK